MKIKKGDMVQVIAGKDKGAQGRVIEAYPKRERVLVEGVNRVKKHVANSYNERGAESGGIVTQEAPIHVSNVMILDSEGTPDPRWLPLRRGRQEGPRGQVERGGHLMTEIQNYTPRLKTRYQDEIRGMLADEFGYDNVMQIPGITKIVVNMGVGDAARDSKMINGALEDLTAITGQKPQLRRAKKSIANFKLREGMPIGAKVTLRGDRMWEFLDRLLTVALPRIRDFRGLSDTQFDGNGNYTFGLAEQTMFYEIDVDKTDRPRGMDITVVTSAINDEEGRALLRHFGFPFKDKDGKMQRP